MSTLAATTVSAIAGQAFTRSQSIKTICAIVHANGERGYFRQCQETTCTIVHLETGGQVILRGRLALMHDRADRSVSWAEEIRRRRLELGLHQDELAALARVSTRFVHTLEQGKPSLQLDKVLAVLGQLGLDLVLEPGTGIIRHGED